MDANELADWLERGYPSKSDLDAAAELRRLKALEKDAIRYQWLKENRSFEFTEHGDLALQFFCDFDNYDNFDAAIDAAMEAK